MVGKKKAFPFRSGTAQDYPLRPLLLNIALPVLATREESEILSIKAGKSQNSYVCSYVWKKLTLHHTFYKH